MTWPICFKFYHAWWIQLYLVCAFLMGNVMILSFTKLGDTNRTVYWLLRTLQCHNGWTPLYFMYDPKCSTTFLWCTTNAPAAFAWCTNHFVHKKEFGYIGWKGVHPLWVCTPLWRHRCHCGIVVSCIENNAAILLVEKFNSSRIPMSGSHINDNFTRTHGAVLFDNEPLQADVTLLHEGQRASNA